MKIFIIFLIILTVGIGVYTNKLSSSYATAFDLSGEQKCGRIESDGSYNRSNCYKCIGILSKKTASCYGFSAHVLVL
jgi:hypothetical protein